MWKIAFFFGMMLSPVVKGQTCNVQNIEGLVAFLKQSPQEKHYKETSNRMLELKAEQDSRRSRPEFSTGLTFDKDNSKNKEINAEVLFNIDDYRNYSTRRDLAQSERNLRTLEHQQDYNLRMAEAAISMFKIVQNQFLREKMDSLLQTISSSESIYRKRPIRSRDEEIILSSLGFLKNNLALKKVHLQDQIFENELQLKKWDGINCTIEYNKFSNLISSLKIKQVDDAELLSFKELQYETELSQYSAALETRRLFGNLKIGPSFSRERKEDIDETRFGVALTFDIPTFNNSNSAYIQQVNDLSSLEKDRAKKIAVIDKSILEERFRKYSESLRQLPSSEKLESDVKRVKNSFETGVVSPLVYLESYRSYVDFLEVSEEVRLNVFESYMKLRGQYVESNI